MTEKTRAGRGLSIGLGLLQIFIGVGGVPGGLIFILDPSGSGMDDRPAGILFSMLV